MEQFHLNLRSFTEERALAIPLRSFGRGPRFLATITVGVDM